MTIGSSITTTGLMGDSQGKLYAADSGWDGRLVFSDSGVPEGVIGRAGKGRGEFERVSAVHNDA